MQAFDSSGSLASRCAKGSKSARQPLMAAWKASPKRVKRAIRNYPTNDMKLHVDVTVVCTFLAQSYKIMPFKLVYILEMKENTFNPRDSTHFMHCMHLLLVKLRQFHVFSSKTANGPMAKQDAPRLPWRKPSPSLQSQRPHPAQLQPSAQGVRQKLCHYVSSVSTSLQYTTKCNIQNSLKFLLIESLKKAKGKVEPRSVFSKSSPSSASSPCASSLPPGSGNHSRSTQGTAIKNASRGSQDRTCRKRANVLVE